MKRPISGEFARFLLLILFTVILVGCSKTSPADILDEGANQFAEGKEEQDYSIKKSTVQLSELIDQYSGGLSIPSGTQIPEEDKRDLSEDKQITVVHNDDEYIRVLRSAMNNLDEDIKIEHDAVYKVDPNKLSDFLILIEREDPLAVCISNINYSYREEGNSVYYTFDYGFDRKTIEQMRQDTKKAVKQITQSMATSGKSDYELVCMVNDYLCDHVVYPSAEPYAAQTHTPYGALVSGDAVCEGYATGAKLIFNELGVVCDIEFGDCIEGGGHAWNLVQVDGVWYQLDTTWNDACGDRTEYLLTTDSFMSNSRTWDTSNYPKCTDTKYHE